jgi:hypothetical protein
MTVAASKRFFLHPSAVFSSSSLQTEQEFERTIRKQKRRVNKPTDSLRMARAFNYGRSQGEEEWNECE